MSILWTTLKTIFQSSRSDEQDNAVANDHVPTSRLATPLNEAGTEESAGNPLLAYFFKNSGPEIHKWVDYFEIYHRVFHRFRGRPIKFLEIGIQNGGSAKMWREYFGPQATIIGVDVDPNCKMFESEGFEVWIGDQADPQFWTQFRNVHPHIDVVVDDGGHTMRQQIVTFENLFETLSDGGVYLCEDTHTSYFPSHGGGLKNPQTFLEYVKNLVDQMHAWYYAPIDQLTAGIYIAQHLYAISVFDSIVVLEKRWKKPPLSIARGKQGHIRNPASMSYQDLRRMLKIPDAPEDK